MLTTTVSLNNSQLSILHSQLSTIHSQFSILNYQLSILNSQLSIINYQFSIILPIRKSYNKLHHLNENGSATDVYKSTEVSHKL